MKNNRPHLYSLRNIVSTAFHYTATLGLIAASFFIGQPWGTTAALFLGVGTALSLINIKTSIEKQNDFFKNCLEKHPETLTASPSLGNIMRELYASSGLKSKDFAVYSFETNKEKLKEKDRDYKDIAEQIGLMEQTHNAAAAQLGKPVFAISKPLLELLNDKEEKAVLAHEFAHAAARHSRLTLPLQILQGVSKMANLVISLKTLGWSGVATVIGTAIATTGLIGSSYTKKKAALLTKKKQDLTPREIVERKALATRIRTLSGLMGMTVASYFNHAYLPIFIAVRSVNLLSKVLTSTFSRSCEYQADKGAVTLGGDPLALVTALRKMDIIQQRAREQNNIPQAGSLTRAWKKATASHPSINNRVKRLAKMARKQGASAENIKSALYDPIDVPAKHDMPYETIKELMQKM